jgi:transposase
VEPDLAGEVDGASKALESQIRAALTSVPECIAQGKAWKNEAPTHTKQQAVAEFFNAKRAAFANHAVGNIAHFEMRKRSKFRSRQETMPFEHYKVTDGTSSHAAGTATRARESAFISLMSKRQEVKLRVRGLLPKELRGRKDESMIREEIKITRTRLGYYYAIVSIQVPQRPRPSTGLGNFCALDPGVRTFQTWYTERERCGKMGSFAPMQEELRKADHIKSLLDTEGTSHKARWRRALRRRFLRHLEKVRNCVADLHHKTATWMARNFRVILLPTFETAQMLGAGHLASRVCRAMQTWGHYKFKTHLQSHAQLYRDVKVRTVSEAYTTRQCGRCGAVNDNVGAAEVFTCQECGHRADRDYHAARNVFLRNSPLCLHM